MNAETCSRCAEPTSQHETQSRCRYNGWTNYETWAVALWIDNDPGTHEYSKGLVEDANEAAPNLSAVKDGIWTVEQGRRFRLAETLKEWVNDALLPDLGASLAADLLGAAVAEVNWDELAASYLETWAEILKES